jgi:ABC-type Mn2+/Zn2+ transport system permease subunit
MILVTLRGVDLSALPPPSDLFELPALRTALLELCLLAVAGGILGAFVVLRRLAFFAHAVGTATFPGLVVAEGLGFSATLAGLVVALGYAGGVERAGRATRDPGDAATALLLVASLAAGIVLASDVFESGAGVDRLLFGTALGLDEGDIALTAGAAALALVAGALLGRAWTAIGFDPASTASLGLPGPRADLLLLGLVACAVVAALPAVGALLVTSIFVVPAAIARLFARTVRGLLAGAVGVAAVQGVLGLYLSLWLDVPPGPAVSVLGATAYLLCAGVTAVHSASRRAPAGAS